MSTSTLAPASLMQYSRRTSEPANCNRLHHEVFFSERSLITSSNNKVAATIDFLRTKATSTRGVCRRRFEDVVIIACLNAVRDDRRQYGIRSTR
ncbi:hypothetical protein AC628_01010 [Bradyrhizobium sp. NAS96.2]|nr:hypothetical protein AC628_01010 [Bradyrhizobium sp. NAS96.2]